MIFRVLFNAFSRLAAILLFSCVIIGRVALRILKKTFHFDGKKCKRYSMRFLFVFCLLTSDAQSSATSDRIGISNRANTKQK